MRKKDFKGRCTKRQFTKCKEVVRTYDKVQTAYAAILDADPTIVEFRCNVPITEIEGKVFTTDYVATDVNGETVVRECCFRKQLYLPRTCRLLDTSRDYWHAKGVNDWAIVIESDEEAQDASK